MLCHGDEVDSVSSLKSGTAEHHLVDQTVIVVRLRYLREIPSDKPSELRDLLTDPDSKTLALCNVFNYRQGARRPRDLRFISSKLVPNMRVTQPLTP